MKKSRYILFIFLLILSACTQSKKALMYVGTYTDGESKGIYSFYFDDQSASLTTAFDPINEKNPSFLTISPNNKYLFSVADARDNLKDNESSIAAYHITNSGELLKINESSVKAEGACHVSVSPDGKLVAASNYRSGSISLFKVEKDGYLSESFQQIQHEGSGPNKNRQTGAHAHSSLFTADGRFLITADLGTDKLNFYQQNENGLFNEAEQAFIKMPPGSGPRHFDFSPDNQFIYVLNELTATVTVLKKQGNEFVEIETISALPKNFTGNNTAADIHLSQDGRFLYSSNRGHNSIAVFQRDQQTGKLKLLETEPVQGDWPRNFSISPDGGYLLVANKKSSNITIFKINETSGLLDYTGNSITVPNPVCIKFRNQ